MRSSCVVLCALFLAMAGGAHGDRGAPILAGAGTAVVDGALSPGEWDRAAGVDFAAAVPAREGGGTVPARMYLMNDGSSLFLAVRVARPSYGLGADTMWIFDANHDGANQDGDDQVGVYIGRFGGVELYDGYRWRCPGAPVGATAHCGAAKDTIPLEGAPPPGQIDTVAAVREGEGAVTFELSHPLDSSDDAHDMSLAPGAVIGFRHFVRLWAATCVDQGCWADSGAPAAHMGVTPPAELGVRAAARPQLVRVGRQVTYSVVLENKSAAAAATEVDVVVRLSSRVKALTARVSQGGCVVSGPITCSLGTIAPAGRVTLIVTARALRVGAAASAVSVTTASMDLNRTDDGASATVRVAPRRR